MKKKLLQLTTLHIALFSIVFLQKANAQNTPITFEPGAFGNTWTWTTFENATNPAVTVVPNPNIGGINTSATCIKMTTLVAGNPWAGFESLHGSDIGTFTLNSTNAVIKLWVYKPVISDVGVKFATPAGASTGEIKVANTLINEWEELTFDFSGQIGNAVNTGIDQIIFFPDFNARTTDNICYIDNVRLGTATPTTPINVKFATQATDSTPVYVFGNWNNWSNFPGTPMTFNASNGTYEAIIPLAKGATHEYLFVNGTGTKEVLNSTLACTNGNAQFTNRKVTLGQNDTTLCNRWASCNACTPLAINSIINTDVQILLNNNFIKINSNTINTIQSLEIFDIVGKQIYSSNGNVKTNENIAVNIHNNTMYIVRIKEGNTYFTVKAILK